MEAQKVKVILKLCVDYVAFHEISAMVLYDLTNNIMVDGYGSYESLEEIQSEINDSGDYCDFEETNAVLVDGKYYYQI